MQNKGQGAIFEEASVAGGRPLSPYLKEVLEIVLASQPPPRDLPTMNGKQMAAHWRRISRLATELIEAVEGPHGRALAATFTLRATIEYQPKLNSRRTLGCDISESPLWWDAVRKLLAIIAESAASEADRQQQESTRLGKGGKRKVDVVDGLLAQIYSLAGAEARERGEQPPDDYQNFRRVLAKHLPPHLLSNVTPEAFAQRPRRQDKRRKRNEG